MKLAKKDLSLEQGITKEWIITNGIGGFCSSTVIGANTRKYHGLLVAPLTPPARRFLMLSKVDESVVIEGKNYPFYTNMGKDYITAGYQYQTGFEKEYVPKYSYEVEDVKIIKTIAMEYGRNTVCLLYHIKNSSKPCKLVLTPVVNFRDFHSMSTGHIFELKQKIEGNKVKIVVDGKSEYPFYMKASEGEYIEHIGDTFQNMFYLEEEKRGFYPEENHAVVGRYEIEIGKEEEKEVSFVFSMEENIDEINSKKVIEKEKRRLEKLIKDTGLIEAKRQTDLSQKEKERQELLREYIIGADNFIVDRPSFGLHTIIAGYPWFLDWGRDSLVSFEGLLLVTKRYDIAKEVLLTFKRDIKFGLVPNGYSGYDNRPLYNSVDASLLLFEQISKYLKYTLDYTFIKENFYETLKRILESYQKGIDLDDNNIYLDTDGLLVSGTENTQNTWMDAKVNGVAITPRNGKAVEINSMWYNALCIMQNLAESYEEKEIAKDYEKMADKCQKAFQKKFYNKDKKCLQDVLGDSKIRPNQLFSLALTYPIINPSSKMAKEILDTVTNKLYTKHGLKTLNKEDRNYVAVYEGNPVQRDSSYHQGITWPWLLGIYHDAYRNCVEQEKSSAKKKELKEGYEKFLKDTSKTFQKVLKEEGCIGSIAELYDSKPPYLPKGAFAQAWSVAEIFRIEIEKEKRIKEE